MAATKPRRRPASGKGRRERRRSHTARSRLPDLRRLYRYRAPPITPGEFAFSVHLLRGGQPPLPIDSVVESVDWSDEEAQLKGTLSLRRPDLDRPQSMPLATGHQVRLRTHWQGRWFDLWTMRCGHPETDKGEGGVSVELADDLDPLRRNRRDWTFRKTKRRKRGFTSHEVTRAVARRERVRLGLIAKGKHRFSRLVKKDASAIDMVKAAYSQEREGSGRRFIIRMRGGRLEVVPYRRNSMLYVLEDMIESASVTREGGEKPVTVLEGKGRLGKGKKAKTVKHTEARRAVVRQHGRVRREKDYGRVGSRGDLRRKVRRDYAKELRVKHTATLSVPFLPFIERGDGARWVTNEPGWYGRSEESRDRSFVFVRAARHRIAGGEQTSEFDIAQDDPFTKDEQRLEREARARKRKARQKAKRRRERKRRST